MKKKLLSLLLLIALVALYVLLDSGTFVFSDFKKRITYPLRYATLLAKESDIPLPVPVSGVALTEIVDTWGAPRPTGRGHNGVDIFAPTGTPIYSATRGFITRKGVGTLGGNYIFITGPGGVRYYYAHMDSFNEDLDVGSEVSNSTVIGYVGNTGNAITTPPHLHFGKYERGAQNPFPFLVERY